MKTKTLMATIAMMLLAAMATPLRFAAQDQNKTYHHYKRSGPEVASVNFR